MRSELAFAEVMVEVFRSADLKVSSGELNLYARRAIKAYKENDIAEYVEQIKNIRRLFRLGEFAERCGEGNAAMASSVGS